MALSGRITTFNHEGTGNYETVNVEIPANLISGSEWYDYRGQTITHSVEISNVTTQSYEDVYVKVTNIQIFSPSLKSDGDNSPLHIESTFWVYGSEASRSEDVNNYMFEEYKQQVWDADTDTDPYAVSYNLFKESFPTDTFIDV